MNEDIWKTDTYNINRSKGKDIELVSFPWFRAKTRAPFTTYLEKTDLPIIFLTFNEGVFKIDRTYNVTEGECKQ